MTEADKALAKAKKERAARKRKWDKWKRDAIQNAKAAEPARTALATTGAVLGRTLEKLGEDLDRGTIKAEEVRALPGLAARFTRIMEALQILDPRSYSVSRKSPHDMEDDPTQEAD